MKFNFLNKIYLAIAFLLLGLITNKLWHYKPWDRYFYSSSICAAYSNPIIVIDATFDVDYEPSSFILSNEDDYPRIYYSNVNDFGSNWGQSVFDAEEDNKSKMWRLPNKLSIEYASIRERKFYAGIVNLPREEIRKIFRSKNRDIPLSFLIGIANNGNVIIWLRGDDFQTTLLKTKFEAERIISGDSITWQEQNFSKMNCFDSIANQMDDSLKLEIAHGFEKNANYIDSPTHYMDYR
jgi:hypothetical protein